MQAKAVRGEEKALASFKLLSKYAPNVSLSTPQKLASLLLWHERRVCQHKRVRRLQEQIAKSTSENRIDVEEELNANLASRSLNYKVALSALA